MSENLLQTLQQLVQDVIAPHVRELKVRVASLEKQIESLKAYVDFRHNLSDEKSDAQFKALMAAISESRAQAELTGLRVLASLSERVAVLEAHRG
jgi:hypothetical protein